MHKFYASGFIYDSSTQQILLQHITPKDLSSSPWTLLGRTCSSEKTAEEAFKKTVLKLLGVKPKNVFSIYTYLDSETHETKIVFYVELRKSKKFPDNRVSSFSWFTLKQISRLKLADQTKQDITVGQRVIDSAIRKSLGQQTLE